MVGLGKPQGSARNREGAFGCAARPDTPGRDSKAAGGFLAILGPAWPLAGAVIQSRYLDPLILRECGGDCWELVQEFRFDSRVLGARIIVPAGFHTDLASTPRVPFAFWLAGGTAEAAATLHDWLYTQRFCPRGQADAVFLEAMTTDGTAVGIPPVPRWRARLMYAGVRMLGASHWA